MSDVVSRLLAAIDEPEKAEIRSRVHTHLKWRLDGSATDRFRVTCRHCDWVAVGPESDVGPLADEHAVRCVSMPISSALRLCQSHRDIVARFQRAWDRRNTGTPDEVAFRQTYVIAMIDVLADLTKGYGVESSEPQPEVMVFTGTPSNFDEVCRFLGTQQHGHREEGYGPDAHLVLHTHEGEVRVSVGDSLLRHEDGRIEVARGYGVEDGETNDGR